MSENEGSKRQGLGRRLLNRFRRPPRAPGVGSAGDRATLEIEQTSPPLSEDELASVKTAYLLRLRERLGTLHLYGLDERRHALQESGRALERLAVYAPLNARRGAPADDSGAEAVRGGARPPAESGEPTESDERRGGPLLELVGRERRTVVRGPHGSGKSTFARFVALALAQRPRTAERTTIAHLEPAWTHGRVTPLLVDLADFAASPHNDETAAGLCAYLADDLGIAPDQLWYQLIAPGGAVLLLDGYEKAPRETLAFINALLDTPNLFIVTCADYGDPTDLVHRGFVEIALLPWSAEQTDVFVHRWYAELECQEWVSGETAQDMPGQLSAAIRREQAVALARRPASMALIATLHLLRGRLPENRTVFYRELTDLALACWSEGRASSERDLRAVFDLDNLRAALGKETYEAYARREEADPLVKLSASDLRATLIQICRNGRWDTVDELTARMLTRPSLLREQQPGVYAFADTSLQAFVAARHLGAQPDLPNLVSRLAREDLQRWREVILSAVSRSVWLNREPTTALQVIEALCRRPLPEEGAPVPDSEWRSAWLAGEALVEIAQAVPGATHVLGRVSSWLLALLERGMLSPKERADAGSVLDQLAHWGPRPGVPVPEPLWCEVPSGMFWSGEGASARIVETGPFWISRYPVTYAQYAAFAQATGHPSPSDWQGERPHAGMGNHPVVHVTWQDAMQYCKWRTDRLSTEQFRVWRRGKRETAQPPPRSWTVRLPTSLEWEKAARGGLSIPGGEDDGTVDNPLPRRVYPWGDSWRLSAGRTAGDETRCNVSESGIGTTTPVGMYPDGMSPYGLMDAAGNVWEWCLDWASDAQRYKIRRGGAFRYSHDYARCAAYDKGYPGLAWPYLGFRVVVGPPAGEGSE